MQSIVAIALTFLAAAVTATPTPRTTSVQFTNDASGRNANVPVPVSGGLQSVATLLDNTALDVDHTFFATSFFLQSNFQGVRCDLVLGTYTIIVDEQRTYAGFAPVSSPLDLVNAQINCYPAY